MELIYSPDALYNVFRKGSHISLLIQSEDSERKMRPFTIACRSEAEAAEIARQMPARLAEPTRREQEFWERLFALFARERDGFPVIGSLIAINISVYVIMGMFGAGWFLPQDMYVYIQFGANSGAETTHGEWWRLITSMFIHYGILHVVVNMLALYQLGAFAEMLMGRALFLLIYFSSGLAGGFASLILNEGMLWSAGASGAVLGIIGAILGSLVRLRKSMPESIFKRYVWSLSCFVIYNLLIGLFDVRVDNFCHVGGLVLGFAFGLLLALPLDPALRKQGHGGRIILGFILLFAVVLAGMLLSPRYNYSSREEYLWGETYVSHRIKDVEMREMARRQIVYLALPAGYADYRMWYSDSFIPFYEKWLANVSATEFSENLITCKRQLLLEKTLRERIDNWKQTLEAFDRTQRTGIFDYNSYKDIAILQEYKDLNARIVRRKLP